MPYYSQNTLILGGEGDFVLDFKPLLENFGFAWTNMATGVPATSLNFNYFSTFFFILLQKLHFSVAMINFILVFLLYFLPFVAVYLVACELKVRPLLSALISIFYIVNPFSIYFLISLNQWNSLILFLIPLTFYIILRFYHQNSKLFLYFGSFTFIFAFVNANPPLMVIYQLSIFISLVFIHLRLESSFKIITFSKKYALLVMSFVIFNSWWILNWLQAISGDISKMYTVDFAVNYAKDLVKAYHPLMFKILSLTGLITSLKVTNYLDGFYNSGVSYVIALIPMLIFVYFLYKYFPRKTSEKFLVCAILLIMFLSKGPSGFLGCAYNFALLHLPFFSVFKTPPEKWGVLFIFFFTLLLLIIFQRLKNDKHFKFIALSFSLYILYCSIPFFTSRFIPDYRMFDGNQSSRKYIDKKEYCYVREKLNADPITYRILSLPGSTNYQVSLLMYGDKHYTGMDPVLSNINKQFIAAYSTNYVMNFDIFFDNFSLPRIARLCSIFNIGKIIVNNNMRPWFGYKEAESTAMLDTLFLRNMKREEQGAMLVYTPQDFLPRFYAASHTALIFGENQALPPLTETILFHNNPALFFVNENNFVNKSLLKEVSGARFDAIVLDDNSSAIFDLKPPNNCLYLFNGSKNIPRNIINENESDYEKIYFNTAEPSRYVLRAILNNRDAVDWSTDHDLLSQPLFKIDGDIYCLKDFKNTESTANNKKIIVAKDLVLSKERHFFQKCHNEILDIAWVILEPQHFLLNKRIQPLLVFKKVNPAKYNIEIKDADSPFWLVFNETFHKKWRIYVSDAQMFNKNDTIAANYINARVQEMLHKTKFCLSDVRYLLLGPLKTEHRQVNGYANVWYIDPDEIGHGKDFILTVYFWPQSLFYLGIVIAFLAVFATLFILFKNIWNRR